MPLAASLVLFLAPGARFASAAPDEMPGTEKAKSDSSTIPEPAAPAESKGATVAPAVESPKSSTPAPVTGIGTFTSRPIPHAPTDEVTPSTTKGPYYAHSENELRARKLARGVANLAFGPAEIPNQMFREAASTSPITGMVVGAGKGLWKGAKRMMIGTWEIATFYAPLKNKYEPYIKPEVVFGDLMH